MTNSTATHSYMDEIMITLITIMIIPMAAIDEARIILYIIIGYGRRPEMTARAHHLQITDIMRIIYGGGRCKSVG